MMNFFGTRLTYLLNGKSYETSIEFVEQLAENNFYIAYYGNKEKFMVTQISQFRDYPQNFYVNCTWRDTSCIERMITDKNMALVLAERPMLEHMRRLHSIPQVVLLKEHLKTIHITAFFCKGYPLFPLINRMLQYLVESGIVKRISEKYNKLLHLNDEPLSVSKLSMQHMVLPLFVWIVGIFLGVVVFCYESMTSRQDCLKK
ncbi:hypothetical protein HHI36_019639 [Cryptolaemus montrouzieri]|uniref:Uncharacterized protein n=1 Tax=Cryptolaemus montrouzieri TaxID=559131 RepID=A0ABD2N8Q2_9CUCU